MSSFGESDLDGRARRALLDALSALEAHLDNLVLIGAQAVYIHTGAIELPIAAATSDADLLLDTRSLREAPEISQLLQAVGFFEGELPSGNPGHWVNRDGIPLDLMQPRGLSSRGKDARAARIPPHSKRAVRIADGLDCALVDQQQESLSSFDPADSRSFQILVAGPAALITAKCFKIYERSNQSERRLLNKDALDVLRLLMSFNTNDLVSRFSSLLENPTSQSEATDGLDYFNLLFASSESALGNQLVARGLEQLGDPTDIVRNCHLLASQLANQLRGS